MDIGDGAKRKHNKMILKYSKDKYGYLRLELSKDGGRKHFRIHRLVIETFLPNPENKPQVNHINGIKNDNRIENLEWCTALENMQHAHKTGLRKYNYLIGEKNHNSKLTKWDVTVIRRLYKNSNYWHNQYILAEIFNVSQCLIHNIINYKAWAAKGAD